jgi:hypothetical protein
MIFSEVLRDHIEWVDRMHRRSKADHSYSFFALIRGVFQGMEWVIEDLTRILESDSMLAFIGFGLLGVPLEETPTFPFLDYTHDGLLSMICQYTKAIVPSTLSCDVLQRRGHHLNEPVGDSFRIRIRN